MLEFDFLQKKFLIAIKTGSKYQNSEVIPFLYLIIL